MGVTGMVGTTHTAEKLCPCLWALESHASPRGHWHLPTLSPCCSLGGGVPWAPCARDPLIRRRFLAFLSGSPEAPRAKVYKLKV